MSSARSAVLVGSVVPAEDVTERQSATLESLVERHRSLVTHIVYRTIGGRPDAEDVCQEALLRVCQGFPGFRSESKASTWIARIAYNTCINYLQKKREVLLDDLPGREVGVEAASAVGARPDERAQSEDLAGLLEAEIRALPPQFRTILTLFHLEDMSYEEIGEVMSLPEGTVKSYLFRARRRLRQRLMRKYSEEDLRP
jgi:RNA polymerase sigma-70 factor (ECF subfamily)